jgi:hypothetical protein
MMMRSAGSEVDSLGLSPPRFCMGNLPQYPLAFLRLAATMGGHWSGPPGVAVLNIPGHALGVALAAFPSVFTQVV